MIRHNVYSCPESVKGQAYLTLVRPCLECACSMWDPHAQKYCRDIEGRRVQRRATRFVKNCHVREPGTVTNLLNDLNQHSLELRRKIKRLTTMYKIENGKIAVNIPEYVVDTTRVTRSYHSSKFINISSSNNTYKYNFFTCLLCNSALLAYLVRLFRKDLFFLVGSAKASGIACSVCHETPS